LKNRRIGIVGYGYVGKSMVDFFKSHFKVSVYDPAYDYGDNDGFEFTSRDQINKCDLVVVCVPTPQAPNGNCDISIVEYTFGWLNVPLVILKSTVDIGTTDYLKKKTGLRVVFSPEFVGESSYWTPYKFHNEIKETPFFIFGGESQDTSEVINFYTAIAGPTKTYRQVSSQEAEAIKYLINTFYALKITFCYEMNEMFETLNLDYNVIRDLWMLDPRINPMHTLVFSENDAPFGGKCFPKDVSALVKFAKRNGYNAKLLEEILESNERIRKRRSKRSSMRGK